jgi:hypothetical protein
LTPNLARLRFISSRPTEQKRSGKLMKKEPFQQRCFQDSIFRPKRSSRGNGWVRRWRSAFNVRRLAFGVRKEQTHLACEFSPESLLPFIAQARPDDAKAMSGRLPMTLCAPATLRRRRKYHRHPACALDLQATLRTTMLTPIPPDPTPSNSRKMRLLLPNAERRTLNAER